MRTNRENEILCDFLFDHITGSLHRMTDEQVTTLVNEIRGTPPQWDEDATTAEQVEQAPDCYREFICLNVGDYLAFYGPQWLLKILRLDADEILERSITE